MSEITTLQPQLLWKWFDQICAIPHPSHHEDALATFIVNWAKEKQFFAERDEAGSVLIRRPATAGMKAIHITSLKTQFALISTVIG